MSEEIDLDEYRDMIRRGKKPRIDSGRAQQPQGSRGEDILAAQIKQVGLPAPLLQHHWAKPAKMYRSDFCWVDPYWLIVEVQGGGAVGRHQNFLGYEDDCRRMALAVVLGYRMLYFTTRMVVSGEAVALLERAINAARLRT